MGIRSTRLGGASRRSAWGIIAGISVFAATMVGQPGGAGWASANAAATDGAATASVQEGTGAPPWKTTRAPLPVNAMSPSVVGVNPDSISCPAPGWCGSALAYVTSTGTHEVALETLMTGFWQALQAPMPPDAAPDPQASPNAISCPGKNSCVAVGSYLATTGLRQGFILRLAGGRWTAAAAPLPSAAGEVVDSTLVSVSCPWGGPCVAAGRYETSAHVFQGYFEERQGTSWAATIAPLPPDAAANPFGGIENISCPTSGRCTAVGAYVNQDGNRVLNVDTLDSGTWSSMVGPLPADAASNPLAYLQTIRCRLPRSCVAVGNYDDDQGRGQGLLVLERAGVWRADSAPLPSDASANPDAHMVSVSCPSAVRCVAVGNYQQSGSTAGLIETLWGSRWRPRIVRLADDRTDTFVAAVSCPAPGSCVVSGNTDVDGLLGTLSQRHWTFVQAPLPPGGSIPFFGINDLSCPNVRRCHVVGIAEAGLGPTMGVFESGGF